MANENIEFESQHCFNKSLWSNKDKTSQFLIPDTIELPSGTFVLRTVTGRERSVDLEAIKQFELNNEQANAWLKEQLGQVLGELGSGLREKYFSSKNQQDKDSSQKDQADNPGAKPLSSTPGLDLLAGITGTARDSLDGDYRAIGHTLGTYFSDIASTVGDAVSGEPQREKSAQQRMRRWGDVLREHGLATEETPESSNTPDNEVNNSAKSFEELLNRYSEEIENRNTESDNPVNNNKNSKS